jgi:hypothetical protein
MRANSLKSEGATLVNNCLGLYRQMEDLYRLRALVDETNREQWIAESKKWRERAELEIESHLSGRDIAFPKPASISFRASTSYPIIPSIVAACRGRRRHRPTAMPTLVLRHVTNNSIKVLHDYNDVT